MSTGIDEQTVRSALAVASRAPSLNNSQPWRWRHLLSTVHLYADAGRQLQATDPTSRELVISCGAMLHHARVAFASLGWRPMVHRLPNSAEPDHLAALQLHRAATLDEDATRLAKAANVRRTDRRPFLPDPVAPGLLANLITVAEAEGATLTFADSPAQRRELTVALAQANTEQRADQAYLAELARWAGRSRVASEGVPASALRARDPFGRSVLGRDFSAAGAGDLVAAAMDDGAVLAVLSTGADERPDWLHAGEALSAVLLEATAHGLATCTLSQVTESRTANEAVRQGVLSGIGEPQVIVRIGWPVTAQFPGPFTRRRPVEDILERIRSVTTR